MAHHVTNSVVTPKISIVIPAGARNRALLPAALRSITTHVPMSLDYETVVVMNDPDRGFVDELRDEFPSTHFDVVPVNIGLAGAANRGRSLVTGELLVILHDDAEVEPEWIESLIDLADTRPDAGVIGGKVMNIDGGLQHAGMILWADGTTSRPWVGDEAPEGSCDDIRAVDYIGTSSLMIRSSVWDEIGGLDERFHPVYYVDVDLAMATRRIGMNVLYQPRSCIRHHFGGSGSRLRREFLSERNRLRFIEKWSDDLKTHEPLDDTIAGITRAMARAERSAEERRRQRIKRSLPPRATHPGHSTSIDALNMEIERTYIAYLEQRVASRDVALAEAWNVANFVLASREAARELLTYRLGVVLDFGLRGAAQLFPHSGGHETEMFGRWLDDQPFTIDLDLDQTTRNAVRSGDAEIALDVIGFLGESRTSARCSIAIAGRSVDSFAVPGEVTQFVTSVPRVEATTLRIVITGHDALSPNEISGSEDHRRLTVGIVSLRIRHRLHHDGNRRVTRLSRRLFSLRARTSRHRRDH